MSSILFSHWLTLAEISPEIIGGGALGFLVLGLLGWQMKANAALYERMRTEIKDLRAAIDACEMHRARDTRERDEERGAYRELLQKYGAVARSLRHLQEQALKTAAVVITDDAGTIVNASAQALALLRYESRDLIGKNVEILVPTELMVAHRRAFKYAAQTEHWTPRGSLHGPALRGDGSRIWLEIDLSRSFRRDAAWTFVAQLREIRSAQLAVGS